MGSGFKAVAPYGHMNGGWRAIRRCGPRDAIAVGWVDSVIRSTTGRGAQRAKKRCWSWGYVSSLRWRVNIGPCRYVSGGQAITVKRCRTFSDAPALIVLQFICLANCRVIVLLYNWLSIIIVDI